MSVSESDRLALRQELERLFGNAKHAETLMRSLPTTEHIELATKSDLRDLRREMEVIGRELRAEIKGETAEITRQMAIQFRYTLLMQLGVLLAVITLMAARG